MFYKHYADLLCELSGEFFDVMFNEWLRADGIDHLPVVDYDMAYCGGGPI